MTHLLDKFSQFAENSDDAAKKALLSDIKIDLDILPHDELKNVAENVDYNRMFSELHSSDRGKIEQLCNVLRTLFDVLEVGRVYERYREAVSKAIDLDDATTKGLVLREFLRMSSEPDKLNALCEDFHVLEAILNSLKSDDLSVAQTASTILKKIAANASGVKLLCTRLREDLIKLVAENRTITLRVLELIVDISTDSKEGLVSCDEAGFLNNLTSLLSDADVLVQLNALELVTKLALTSEGLAYLESHGILKQLADKIARIEEEPLVELLVPGLIKFFGNVAQKMPNEIFSRYPVVISSLFTVINSENLALLPVALDTLGHIARRADGKYALATLGEVMPTTMKTLAEIVERLPAELRVRGLNNLAAIIGVEESEQNNRILSLTKSWFDAMGDEPLDAIVQICKQPFADIRLAALEVLRVVAEQTWGQEYIANAPGLVEFLLDRNVESFKECKEAKFLIVRALSAAGTNIFDSNTIQRFQRFVNEGAMYVEALPETATESGP